MNIVIKLVTSLSNLASSSDSLTLYLVYPFELALASELLAHLCHALLTNGEAPSVESQVTTSVYISSTRDGCVYAKMC